MAKIGTGSSKTGEGTEAPTAVSTKIVIPKTSSGQIDYAALYDKVDVEKVTRAAHAAVSAEQIREVIDGLFDSGKKEIAVATVCDMVNVLHNLEKTDEADTRVQNSSVRSAGTSAKKYRIVTIGVNAFFQKNPDYDPNAPRKAKKSA